MVRCYAGRDYKKQKVTNSHLLGCLQILLMFVKCIFEEIERHRAEKSVTLTRPAIAGQLKTAIMKADGFTCTAPSHERSRSAETY